MSSSETYFVTGATGFIGTKLVHELVEQGHSVHALTRAASNREGLLHERVKLVQGDITDKDSLEQGMKGCTRVFHLAAYAKNWSRDKQVFYRQNIDGMVNVVEAARKNNIQRMVFTSTIVVFGPSRPGEVRDESMPRITQRYFTDYEESKAMADRKALEFAAAGFPILMVAPSRVYGPGKLTEGNSVTKMIDMYDRGQVPILLNRGVNVGNYVLVDDLVRGHILAMEKGRVGEQYILGGENISLKGFFKLVDEVSGKRHVQFNLTPPVGMVYGNTWEFVARTTNLYPQITPGWVETFLQDWAYSCAKAERELGYLITPLREGIRTTYQWLLAGRRKGKRVR